MDVTSSLDKLVLVNLFLLALTATTSFLIQFACSSITFSFPDVMLIFSRREVNSLLSAVAFSVVAVIASFVVLLSTLRSATLSCDESVLVLISSRSSLIDLISAFTSVTSRLSLIDSS